MRAIAIQGAGAAFSALVSFVLLVMLARIFGTASFGSYVALLGVAVLGLILIEGGWATRLYRQAVDAHSLAAPHERVDIRHAVAHVATMGLALSVVAWTLGRTAQSAAAMAFGCMIMVALANLVSARMRGAGNFAQEALWQGGGRLASAALILVAVTQIASTPEMVFASWAVALALLLLWGRTWLAPPQWRGLAGNYRLAVPFLVIDGCAVFLLRGDIAVLGALDLPAEHLSYYAAGTRFTEAGVLLFAPVTNVLLRTLRVRVHDEIAFERELRFALALALCAGLMATIATLLLGEPVMSLVFGPDYRDAGKLLPWVTASLPMMLVNLVLMQAAISRGRERQIALRLLAACALLALGLVFGSRFHGVHGAAVAVFTVHVALGLMLLRLLRPERVAMP